MRLGWKWFTEFQTENSAHMHGIRAVLHSEKTEFQEIDVVDSVEYGKMLLLDGKVQSTVRDEAMYHEALVSPAMISAKSPESVLIVGGGEGGTLREVLKHRTVRRATMVDIDRMVVEVSKELLPEISAGAFEDPRAEVVFADGRKFLEGCDDLFDVIIMDVTDPLEGGPAALLYTREFYRLARERLKDKGILVTQATSTYYSDYCFATIFRTVKGAFPKAGGYQAWVPSYDSMWGFVYGTGGADPALLEEVEVDRMLSEGGIEKRHYDGRVHRSYFALPKDLMLKMASGGRAATDEEPTFMPV